MSSHIKCEDGNALVRQCSTQAENEGGCPVGVHPMDHDYSTIYCQTSIGSYARNEPTTQQQVIIAAGKIDAAITKTEGCRGLGNWQLGLVSQDHSQADRDTCIREGQH